MNEKLQEKKTDDSVLGSGIPNKKTFI